MPTEEKMELVTEDKNSINAVKLTNWSNEPSVMQLKEDLEAAKSFHDTQVGKVEKWRDLSNITGSAKPPKVKGRSSVQPKLIRRQAEWRYSALSEPFLGSDKLYDVKPVSFEDKQSAVQNELVLNWQFRTKLNRVKFIDDYIRTNVDEGSCVVRVGWNRVLTKVKKTVPEYTHYAITDETQLQAFQQALEMKQANPKLYESDSTEEVKAAVAFFEENGQPNIALPTGSREIEEDKVIINQPTLDILDIKNFYVDPSCQGDISKANFACITFETSQAELKKEPKRYKNLDKVNWDNAAPVSNPDHATNVPDTFQFKDALRKRVIAYEYWGFYDISGDGVLEPIVATWINDTLIRMEKNPFPDKKLPFVVTNYLPVKRELFGEADAELLEDNQKILGAVTRGMIDLLGRSANGQHGFAKGMLDVVNRRRYENGQDYEYNPNNNPAQALIEHKYPEIPNSAMNMLTLQNQEAEALTGVKAFSGGMSGEAFGDVAAGIRGVLDASSKREMAILRRMAAGIVEIGKKIISMNAHFLSEEEIIRVTNETEEFVTVKREELHGDFDLQADISTAEIDNNKAQDLAFMLQTMGNNMDFNIVKIILTEIARLKRMPDLAKTISMFEPQPDPLAQALKEAEVQKVMKEIEKLDSEIALNRAKAQEALTKANQNDLDTTEQETGTKHVRDMEKQAGQARGNQDLEVTKALLKSKKPEESTPDVEAAIGYNEISKPNTSTLQRDQAAQVDPTASLGSQFFDPRLDPALNPAINI